MKPRHSQRKQRQQGRLLPEQVAMHEVHELALPACVESVEDEFQGEWNTLCIFVRLGSAASASEVAELKELFSQCLERALSTASAQIEWSVGFWKADELLGSVDSS